MCARRGLWQSDVDRCAFQTGQVSPTRALTEGLTRLASVARVWRAMPLSGRRVQLAAPPQAIATDKGVPPVALSLTALGKRAITAEDDDYEALTPPNIVKRRLVGVGPESSAAGHMTICAAGCLRDPTHVGLCLTKDGPAPPSAKRVARLAKAWQTQH